MAQVLGPLPSVGDPVRVPGSQPQPVPSLAVTDIWGVNQRMKYKILSSPLPSLPLSSYLPISFLLSVALSFKKENKLFFEVNEKLN